MLAYRAVSALRDRVLLPVMPDCLQSTYALVHSRYESISGKSIRMTGRNSMEKWICTVCGYVYDPAVGDSTQGIEPGIKFEDLPSDWVCPDCGAGKDLFEKA